MSRLNLLLCGALFAFGLIAGPGVRAEDEKAVILIVKPKVGRVVRTKLYIKVNMSGMDMVMNGVEKDTVKEVHENGDVVFEIVDEGGIMSANGAKAPLPVELPYTKTVSRLGTSTRSKKYSGDESITPEVDKLLNSISDLIVTGMAVKANDTWDTELDNPIVKEKKVTLKSIFLGFEKLNGKDTWKIKQTAEAATDTNGELLTYEMTTWIDPINGGDLKSEGVVKNVPVKLGRMSMQISSRAITADDDNRSASKTGAAKLQKKDK